MTGPEHYQLAEAKLWLAERISRPDSGHTDEEATVLVGLAIQRAQVHATLALAAATALIDEKPRSGSFDAWREWRDAAGPQPEPGTDAP